MNNIEVELRGPLSEEAHLSLLSYLEAHGKLLCTQKRTFFDLSPIIGINNRTLDVRARVTNGKIQIVAKKAKPGSVSREEAEIYIEEGTLKETLHLLSLLGYTKGIQGDRYITRYVVDDIEIAIQDVVTVTDGALHSRFYEAEILTNTDNREIAETQLREFLAKLSLPIFDVAGWNKYEMEINTEANGWYESASTSLPPSS